MIRVKWPKVMDYKDFDQRPIINWIDLANGTMFRIAAFFCHGGFKYPRIGLMIALERIGMFFFSIDHKISYQYLMDKLFIPEADARNLADWMNVQLGFDVAQQGEYNRTYILETEPYGLIGENKVMPLVPEIVE